MANREFSDLGRPELFNEDGEFQGSAADYDGWKCAVCGDVFNGISEEDAAEDHEAYGPEGDDAHEFVLAED